VRVTVEEGKVTALISPTGLGKSVYALLPARLWDIGKGAVEMGSAVISTVNPEALLIRENTGSKRKEGYFRIIGQISTMFNEYEISVIKNAFS
jgi:ABC-type enterochelin transport system ATPase subunit